MGFFSHKRVGFVDVGWNGTIQFFLDKCFASLKSYPKIFGLYFAFFGGIPYKFSQKNHLEGIFFDKNRGLPVENSVMAFEEIFEEAARSLDPTVVGYRKDSVTNSISPVFKSNQSPDRIAEIKCNPIVEELQKGILDFAESFYKDIMLTGYSYKEIKHFIYSLAERAIVYPRKEEVQQLSKLVHTEDWGHDNILEVGINHSIFNLPNELKSSNWKYGTISRWFGWPGAFLTRLFCLLKNIYGI